MTDDLLSELTVADGSCRDINFFGVTRAGAERLLTSLTTQFEAHIGRVYPSADELQPIDDDDFATPLDAGHAVQGEWSRGSPLFEHLQYFVVPSLGDHWFVELTFFPQDLHLDGTLMPLKVWLRNALAAADACGAYIRFENVSFDPTWECRDAREVLLTVVPPSGACE